MRLVLLQLCMTFLCSPLWAETSLSNFLNTKNPYRDLDMFEQFPSMQLSYFCDDLNFTLSDKRWIGKMAEILKKRPIGEDLCLDQLSRMLRQIQGENQLHQNYQLSQIAGVVYQADPNLWKRIYDKVSKLEYDPELVYLDGPFGWDFFTKVKDQPNLVVDKLNGLHYVSLDQAKPLRIQALTGELLIDGKRPGQDNDYRKALEAATRYVNATIASGKANLDDLESTKVMARFLKHSLGAIENEETLKNFAKLMSVLRQGEEANNSGDKRGAASEWEESLEYLKNAGVPKTEIEELEKQLTRAMNGRLEYDSCKTVCWLLDNYDKWKISVFDPDTKFGTLYNDASFSRKYAYVSLQMLFAARAIPYCMKTPSQAKRKHYHEMFKKLNKQWEHFRGEIVKHGDKHPDDRNPHEVHKPYAKSFSLLTFRELKNSQVLQNILGADPNRFNEWAQAWEEDFARAQRKDLGEALFRQENNPVHKNSNLETTFHYAFNLQFVPRPDSVPSEEELKSKEQSARRAFDSATKQRLLREVQEARHYRARVKEMEQALERVKLLTKGYARLGYKMAGTPAAHESEAVARTTPALFAMTVHNQDPKWAEELAQSIVRLEHYTGSLRLHIGDGSHWPNQKGADRGKGYRFIAPYYFYPGIASAMSAIPYLQKHYPQIARKHGLDGVQRHLKASLFGQLRKDGFRSLGEDWYGHSSAWVQPLVGLSLLPTMRSCFGESIASHQKSMGLFDAEFAGPPPVATQWPQVEPRAGANEPAHLEGIQEPALWPRIRPNQ